MDEDDNDKFRLERVKEIVPLDLSVCIQRCHILPGSETCSPLCTHSGTLLYPEGTTPITKIEAAGLQLKPEMYPVHRVVLRFKKFNFR